MHIPSIDTALYLHMSVEQQRDMAQYGHSAFSIYKYSDPKLLRAEGSEGDGWVGSPAICRISSSKLGTLALALHSNILSTVSLCSDSKS